MARQRTTLLNTFRPWVQGLFLFLFLYLFTRLTFPFTRQVIDNFFFTFDPLVTTIMIITGTIGLTAIIGAVVMMALTLLFGRFFCGFLCPMGTMFDLSARFFPKRTQSKPFGKGRFKNIKYYTLAFLFGGSLLGFTTVLFFDPLVFIYRVFTVNIYPMVISASNMVLDMIRPLALKLGMYELSMLSWEQPVYSFGIASLLMFVAVIGLIVIERRFWCRNLCPLGAFLSVFSRFSLRKRSVSDACIDCGRCARECPMNAIDEGYRDSSSRECIQCDHCTTACPTGAISFGMGAPLANTEYNPSRRGMLATAVGGVTAGFAASSAVATMVHHGDLLRPPGALVEKDFLDACLRCGKCMKVCPTHALQPAGLESGVEGLFTPVLTPRVGACEEQCNLCGQVCPTGAIRSLPLKEKQYATIGNATIERNLCIAWEQGKVCLICDEVCPYDAVEFRVVNDEVGSIKRPFVIEDKCVGCGQCEKGCPVNGPAAIHVTPVNEVRLNEGSYITEEKRRLREVTDDFQDFSHEQGTAGTQTPSYETPGGAADEMPEGFDMPEGFSTGGDELPEGFTR